MRAALQAEAEADIDLALRAWVLQGAGFSRLELAAKLDVDAADLKPALRLVRGAARRLGIEP